MCAHQALFYKAKPLPSYEEAVRMFGRGSSTTKEQLVERLRKQRDQRREKRRLAAEEAARKQQGRTEARL
jgi:hypothetical protein